LSKLRNRDAGRSGRLSKVQHCLERRLGRPSRGHGRRTGAGGKDQRPGYRLPCPRNPRHMQLRTPGTGRSHPGAGGPVEDQPVANLGAIFTAEIAHFGERNTYATTFDEIGWAPAGNNLYTYYLPDDVVPSASGQTYPLPSGVEPVAGDSLRVVAVGNIDNDDTLDVWTINNMKQLINVVNDVLQ